MSGVTFYMMPLRITFPRLHTTLKDVQDLETRVMYISAGRDAWIDDKDLQNLQTIDRVTFVKVVGRTGGFAPSSRKSKKLHGRPTDTSLIIAVKF